MNYDNIFQDPDFQQQEVSDNHGNTMIVDRIEGYLNVRIGFPREQVEAIRTYKLSDSERVCADTEVFLADNTTAEHWYNSGYDIVEA